MHCVHAMPRYYVHIVAPCVNTSLAFNKGVFGSPTFLIGKEVFFGDDRFEDAILFAKGRDNK